MNLPTKPEIVQKNILDDNKSEPAVKPGKPITLDVATVKYLFHLTANKN